MEGHKSLGTSYSIAIIPHSNIDETTQMRNTNRCECSVVRKLTQMASFTDEMEEGTSTWDLNTNSHQNNTQDTINETFNSFLVQIFPSQTPQQLLKTISTSSQPGPIQAQKNEKPSAWNITLTFSIQEGPQ